jgi:hypothetical protein
MEGKMSKYTKEYKEMIDKAVDHLDKTSERLSVIYNDWGEKENLQPLESADDKLTEEQRDWLDEFIVAWDASQDVESFIYNYVRTYVRRPNKSSIKKMEKRLEKKAGLYNYD